MGEALIGLAILVHNGITEESNLFKILMIEILKAKNTFLSSKWHREDPEHCLSQLARVSIRSHVKFKEFNKIKYLGLLPDDGKVERESMNSKVMDVMSSTSSSRTPNTHCPQPWRAP